MHKTEKENKLQQRVFAEYILFNGQEHCEYHRNQIESILGNKHELWSLVLGCVCVVGGTLRDSEVLVAGSSSSVRDIQRVDSTATALMLLQRMNLS